ncbi:venom carboxylesterase-6-like [Agrilus planipennis]|uniref:Carboxylic ester hydrolase n=1 Tax=Agrilus planipennis TaxID=224129 RepID=A0A7F5R008_AGRPL|nr:venom carboxylesterase-6-like [Agrilus planipennis]
MNKNIKCCAIRRYFVIFLIYYVAFCAKANVKVTVKQGEIEGKLWKSKQGRTFSAFLSIPYAEAPVGDLRFRPPVPVKSWSGIKDATKDHDVCPQRNIYTRSDLIEGNEDCLYLNVYTPKITNKTEELVPVMVFIHGGGWLCCAGNSLYYGPDILLENDIVLVVPNYRLGPLGFLSTGDEIVPGNNGLKDQSLALKWIKENIQQFGGDPNKITVFGESAGGSSTHFLMMSPLTKDLLYAGISQSGNAFTSWSLSRHNETENNSRKLASLLNCPENPSTAMVECLRKIDSHTIIAQDEKLTIWDTDPMIPFKPVIEPNVEGAFLSEHPLDIIKSRRMADVPWITGINTGDGALRSAGIFGNQHLLQEFEDKFDDILQYSLLYYHLPGDKQRLTHRIKHFYFQTQNPKHCREIVTNLFTDAWFLDGTDAAVRLHIKYLKSPVFLYLFGYRGTSSYTEIFGDPDQDYGSCHADELQYLFPVGDVLFHKESSENDKQMTEVMSNLWVNFAKTRNPTPKKLEANINEKWLPATSEDMMEYYSIENDKTLKMKTKMYNERVQFWRKNSPYLNLKSSRSIDEL